MEQLRRQIIEAGKKLDEKGFVSSNDGNISAVIDDKTILATPTGFNKGVLKRDDLVIVDREGKKISGKYNPSSEILMHLGYYKKRPDVKAVVHAHPPYSTGFATAGLSLEKCVFPEVILTIGAIPLAQYGTPSTDELVDSISELVVECDAILLANHGAVTAGKDVMDAYWKMERVEHIAKISYIARTLGGEKVLPKTEVKKLVELREKMGGSGPYPLCWDCDDCVGDACVLNNIKDSGNSTSADIDIDNIVKNVLKHLT
ncbi:MAG: class II aldolase/adducin family protein [bacterium]|nr:class II aldolase/adducin family protein [bacterium]